MRRNIYNVILWINLFFLRSCVTRRTDTAARSLYANQSRVLFSSVHPHRYLRPPLWSPTIVNSIFYPVLASRIHALNVILMVQNWATRFINVFPRGITSPVADSRE
ncbi:hypothetical protein PUN28_010558 [Cardiocondyla obscurior]|uniref:Secreted protein n=1 Tax=Cardiocondyla obscurior TaxID=286306 RepID=A0AAW2FGG4_9HYME